MNAGNSDEKKMNAKNASEWLNPFSYFFSLIARSVIMITLVLSKYADIKISGIFSSNNNNRRIEWNPFVLSNCVPFEKPTHSAFTFSNTHCTISTLFGTTIAFLFILIENIRKQCRLHRGKRNMSKLHTIHFNGNNCAIQKAEKMHRKRNRREIKSKHGSLPVWRIEISLTACSRRHAICPDWQ